MIVKALYAIIFIKVVLFLLYNDKELRDTLLSKETIMEFIILTDELKEYLKEIVKNHPEDDEFMPTDTEEEIIQTLQKVGYLHSFRKDVLGYFTAKYNYEDENYDFLEQEYKKSVEVNTYNFNNCNNFSLAGNSATVNVNVHSGISNEELNDIVRQILNTSSDEMMEEVHDLLELIYDELRKQSPKKNKLQVGLDALKALKGTVEFSSAVSSLIAFISTYFSQ